MKAITRGRTRKEVVEDSGVKQIFKEQTFDLWKKAVKTGMCTVLGTILYILYRRGWHKDKLNALIDDVIAILQMPATPQGNLDNEQVIQYMQSKGVDPMRIYEKIKFFDLK